MTRAEGMRRQTRQVIQGVARQGDVGLVPTTRQPSANATPIRDRGRTILAYGEVTGHAHEVVAGVANPDPVPAMALFEEPDGTRLLVVRGPAALQHEEHGPIALVPGRTYEVIQQVEWSLDDVRAVAD